MSDIGYYRYKVASVGVNGSTVVFSVNGNPAKTVTITPVQICTGARILKYLNRDGQYRFFPFSNYYEELDIPTEIGKTNKLITSILTAKSSNSSIGYKSDRVVNLYSEPVSETQLEILKDIYTSPRVYLYIGTGNDNDSDWIEVTIKADRHIRKEAKKKFSRICIEVKLPETYSITML
jgi:hypothetical protein